MMACFSDEYSLPLKALLNIYCRRRSAWAEVSLDSGFEFVDDGQAALDFGDDLLLLCE